MPASDQTGDLASDPPTHSVTSDPATANPPPDLTGDLAPAAAGGPPAVPGYTVHEVLGRGGMGVVYRAVHLKLNREVALKVARADDRADHRHLLRFLAEAEAAAAVRHPHVVGVYDSGAAGGRPYLAMEVCPGGTLADRLKAGRLDPRDAAVLVGKLAGAVQACHDAGIIHRDLKPANVLFDAAGEPKVTDFGLVKRGLGSDLTATQAVMGTPAYMTPEQAQGDTKFVGPAADVYALGTILYECLTGTRPFDSPDALVLLKLIVEDPPEPPRRRVPSLPRDLERVCLRCLEKAPADRYPSAAALADDLRRFAAGEPVSVRAAGVLERVYKWARRKPTVAALWAATLAGAVLVAVATAIGLLWRDAEAARGVAEAERSRAEAAQGEAERTRDQIAGEQGKTAAALKDAESARDLLRKEQDKLALSEYARTMEVAHQEALGNNVAGAMALLDGTRPDLRGWEWHYVHKLCNGQRLTIPGESISIGATCWSPDGSRLVTTARDHMVRVRDSRSGAELVTLRGHTGEVSSATWSPDGSKLATISEDATARVWDARTGEVIAVIRGRHNRGVLHAALWSPDGSRLAMVPDEETVRVWEVTAGAEVAVLKGLQVGCIAWSPDGAKIVGISGADAAHVWDARTGIELATLRGATNPWCTAWSPDSLRVAVLFYDDHSVRLWDIQTGATPVILPDHPDAIRAVAWGPDGKWIATGCGDGIARVWDASTGAAASTLDHHTNAIEAVVWSPDGSRLATASFDGTARVWDGRTGAELVALRGHTDGIYALAWSPDGRRLATGGPETGVKVWDVVAESKRAVPHKQGASLWAVAWSPNRSLVAYSSRDRVVRVWDAHTHAQVAGLVGHTGDVLGIAWCPHGRRLATCSSDGTARVWDSHTGALLVTLRGHLDYVNAVAWSPDGSRVATSSNDLTVRIWNARTGDQVGYDRGGRLEVLSIDWSPDGSRVATGGNDGMVQVWGTGSGKRTVLVGAGASGGAFWGVAWSPDGRRLAAVGFSGLRLLDPATGTEDTPVARFGGGIIEHAAWSPDGRRLALGCNDGTVRIWSPTTGTAVLTLSKPQGGNRVSGITWSVDGSQLTAAYSGGTLRTWDATPSDPRFLGKRVAPPPREAKR